MHQWEVSRISAASHWPLSLQTFQVTRTGAKRLCGGKLANKLRCAEWLSRKREPRSSLSCTLSPPSEQSSEVIIWQKTLWNTSDSWNYDEDEAWLLCRPHNLCSVSGRYATVGMGRWVGGNKDREEHEAGGLVYICEPKSSEDRLKYEFRFSMCIWIFRDWELFLFLLSASNFSQPANMTIAMSLESSCSYNCWHWWSFYCRKSKDEIASWWKGGRPFHLWCSTWRFILHHFFFTAKSLQSFS